MIGSVIAVGIIAVALVILAGRIRAFLRTGGRSACRNCPYSGTCAGSERKEGGCRHR